MKLLVISDTHGDISKAYDIIKSINSLIDGIIHCGDIVEDALAIKRRFPDIPMYNVRGNCDYGSSVENEVLLNIGGKKIFVTHGDLYSVEWNTDRLCYKGAEKNADACIYGHTHVPDVEYYNDMVIMNPGSLTRPRGGSKPSYGILKIEDGVITPVVLEYKDI